MLETLGLPIFEELISYLSNKSLISLGSTNEYIKLVLMELLKRCDKCAKDNLLCIKNRCQMKGCEHYICLSDGFKLRTYSPVFITKKGFSNKNLYMDFVGCNKAGYCSICHVFKGFWEGDKGIKFRTSECSECWRNDLCLKCLNNCYRKGCDRLLCTACSHTCNKCGEIYCVDCMISRGILTEDSHKCLSIRVSFENMPGIEMSL